MIYKYRSFNSQHKFDIFTNAEVYFSRPSEFNDPFESKPQITGLDTLKQRQEYINNYIKRELKDKNYKERQALKKKFMIRFSDLEIVKKDIHQLLDTYGIFSASRKWDQCLMWSHYSDSHKGFCIGFEFEEEFDDDMGMSQEVIYAESYPNLNPELFIQKSDNNTAKILVTTLATKSSEWSYEDEVRYIKIARDGGSGIYKFQSHKVKELILGACMAPENKRDLFEITKKYTPWVNVYQAMLSSSNYELYKEPTKLTSSSSGRK